MISGKPERAMKPLPVLHISIEGFNAIKMAARKMKRRGSDIQRQALTEWFAKHAPSYAPNTFNPPEGSTETAETAEVMFGGPAGPKQRLNPPNLDSGRGRE